NRFRLSPVFPESVPAWRQTEKTEGSYGLPPPRWLPAPYRSPVLLSGLYNCRSTAWDHSRSAAVWSASQESESCLTGNSRSPPPASPVTALHWLHTVFSAPPPAWSKRQSPACPAGLSERLF